MAGAKTHSFVAIRLKSRLAYSFGIMAIGTAIFIWHAVAYGNYGLWLSSQFRWTLATSFIMVVASFVINVPDEPNRLILALRAAAAATVSHGVFAMIQGLTAEQYLPRFVVAVSLVGWPAYAVVFSIVVAKFSPDQRITIWTFVDPSVRQRLETASGAGSASSRLMILDAPTREISEFPTRENAEPLPQLIVYDARSSIAPALRRHLLAWRNRGVRIRSVADFFEDVLDRVSLDDVDFSDLASDVREIHNVPYRRLSRVIDVATGLMLVSILVLVLPVVWIGNVLGNRGPLIYRQARIGQAGREFEILKFRTMTESAAPTNWTSSKDSRITPFGRLLRLCHLDELPQAINIIRGDLAIVGPRPEQPHYVSLLRDEIPFYDQRHAVRPGLTGWAQVNYPYGASVEDARRKLEYDLYYVRHQSLGLDLRILAHTSRHVLGFKGR